MDTTQDPHLAPGEIAENETTPTVMAANADATDAADGPTRPPDTSQPSGQEEKKKGPSQATLLIQLAANCSLFHSPDRKGYITIPIGKHTETYPVVSTDARGWLRKEFFRVHRKPAADSALDSALKTLEATAVYDCPEIPVHLRVAEHD
jgi:putative DNA primase/helicase